MKESIRRIQQVGSSEPLLELVKRMHIQSLSVESLKNDNEHVHFTVFNHNRLCWYHEGTVEKSSSVLLEVSVDRAIEVDVQSHRLSQVNGEEVNGIEHNQVLDLSDDGERWEGDVLNNEPYGWGVLYDSENRMVYEGFRIGDVDVCYGRSYYADVGVMEYEGEWCEGKRWGRGIQYDRSGKTVFDEEWINDEHLNKRVVLNEENQLLHNHVEELIVENNSCNGLEWKGVDFSILVELRELRVGNECFENVEEVKLIGMDKLERVLIGKNSFTKKKNHYGIDSDRHFYLKNCPKVKELKMGRYSFSDYDMCEIENVPSLEVIEMGKLNKDSCNFLFASLELKSDSERMK